MNLSHILRHNAVILTYLVEFNYVNLIKFWRTKKLSKYIAIASINTRAAGDESRIRLRFLFLDPNAPRYIIIIIIVTVTVIVIVVIVIVIVIVERHELKLFISFLF